MEKEKSTDKADVRRGPYSQAEKTFITRHSHLTDREIGEKLRRNPKGINRIRQELGLGKKSKSNDLKSKEVQEDIIEQKINHPDGNIKVKGERENFFFEEFKNSHYYSMVKSMLLDDELEFYIREWAAYMAEVETLTAAEKRTLNKLILAEIDEMRYRRQLTLLQMADHNDPKLIKQIMDGIESSQTVFMKLSQELKLSRKQRLEGKTEGGFSLTKLIKKIQTEDERRRIGDFGGAIQMATEKKRQAWRDKGILKGDDKDNEGEKDDTNNENAAEKDSDNGSDRPDR